MEIPDLIGIKLEEALEVTKAFEDSYSISIKETISPFLRNEYKKNECRVVRQQIFDNTITIMVSYF